MDRDDQRAPPMGYINASNSASVSAISSAPKFSRRCASERVPDARLHLAQTTVW
jgi:hypothetical protein